MLTWNSQIGPDCVLKGLFEREVKILVGKLGKLHGGAVFSTGEAHAPPVKGLKMPCSDRCFITVIVKLCPQHDSVATADTCRYDTMRDTIRDAVLTCNQKMTSCMSQLNLPHGPNN